MNRIALLDISRFFAAIAVMIFHYSFWGINNGKLNPLNIATEISGFTKYGYLGVEFFFLVSGYVIAYSSKDRSAHKFLYSRCLRLYPAYWCAVITTGVFSWFFASDILYSSLAKIIVNLSMLQSFVGVSHVDGVYWSLVIELQFYCLIFLLLILNKRIFHQPLLPYFFIVWPLVMLVAKAFHVGNVLYLGGYFSFFAAGALFYQTLNSKSNKAIFYSSCTALTVAFYLSLDFSIGKVALMEQATEVAYSRNIVVCIITAYFLFFMLLFLKKIRELRIPLSHTLGGLSYSIYLLHAYLGYMLINSMTGLTTLSKLIFVTGIIMGLSAFLYFIIEKKCRVFWQKLFTYVLRKP